MRMLGIADKINKNLFSYLPILPYDNHEIIFDPAGYGQYLTDRIKIEETIFLKEDGCLQIIRLGEN